MITGALGIAFTVTPNGALDDDTQPLLSVTVYVIFVVPGATPVTTPVASIVPLAVELDNHDVIYAPDPPLGLDVIGIFKFTQTSLTPDMAPAIGLG